MVGTPPAASMIRNGRLGPDSTRSAPTRAGRARAQRAPGRFRAPVYGRDARFPAAADAMRAPHWLIPTVSPAPAGDDEHGLARVGTAGSRGDDGGSGGRTTSTLHPAPSAGREGTKRDREGDPSWASTLRTGKRTFRGAHRAASARGWSRYRGYDRPGKRVEAILFSPGLDAPLSLAGRRPCARHEGARGAGRPPPSTSSPPSSEPSEPPRLRVGARRLRAARGGTARRRRGARVGGRRRRRRQGRPVAAPARPAALRARVRLGQLEVAAAAALGRGEERGPDRGEGDGDGELMSLVPASKTARSPSRLAAMLTRAVASRPMSCPPGSTSRPSAPMIRPARTRGG